MRRDEKKGWACPLPSQCPPPLPTLTNAAPLIPNRSCHIMALHMLNSFGFLHFFTLWIKALHQWLWSMPPCDLVYRKIFLCLCIDNMEDLCRKYVNDLTDMFGILLWLVYNIKIKRPVGLWLTYFSDDQSEWSYGIYYQCVCSSNYSVYIVTLAMLGA